MEVSTSRENRLCAAGYDRDAFARQREQILRHVARQLRPSMNAADAARGKDADPAPRSDMQRCRHGGAARQAARNGQRQAARLDFLGRPASV